MRTSDQRKDFGPFMARVRVALGVGIIIGLFTTILRLVWHIIEYGRPKVMDFDLFRLVGRLVLEGKTAQAYVPQHIYAAEHAVGFGNLQVPWAYPPQLDLLTPLLTLLPRVPSFAVYMIIGLAGALLLLRRIAGESWAMVLIASWPGLLLELSVGQTSLLMTILAGFYVLGMLGNRRGRGVPLGLMVIKPHLALGFGLHAVIRRDWRAVGEATMTIAATSLVATTVFGTAIWPAFIGGVRASSEFLQAGGFVHFRLMSTFASLTILGVPAVPAMAAQALIALLAAGLLLQVHLKGLPLREQLGVAALCTLLISPYSYDYDMAMFAVAMALLWPVLSARATLPMKALIVLSGWSATGWSTFLLYTHHSQNEISAAVGAGHIVMFPGLLLVALTVAIAAFLLRQPQDVQAAVPQPA